MTFLANAPNLVVAIGRIAEGELKLLGTAFFVENGVLATAAHVTGGDDTNLIFVVPTITNLEEYQDTTRDRFQQAKTSIIAIDPMKDVCLLNVDSTNPYFSDYGNADKLKPGSEILCLGFPHADQGRLVLTQHIRDIRTSWNRLYGVEQNSPPT